MAINQERLKKVLGLEPYQTNNRYVCFLPFRGEFGWYLMTFVKRVQGYNHTNKIVCIKSGHEALFPTASNFFYDWKDCLDNEKAGIFTNQDEELIKNKIINFMGTDDIHFVSSSETSWEEKDSLSNNTFIPKPCHNYIDNFVVDICLCPRKREVDAHRNWTKEKWQTVVNILNANNITTAICGTKDTSFNLENVKYKSYDYIDVDTDIKLMLNSKLVIVQESGLQYLSFLCERPTFCIDHYHKDYGADLHRNKNVAFKALTNVWENPNQLVVEIKHFLEK